RVQKCPNSASCLEGRAAQRCSWPGGQAAAIFGRERRCLPLGDVLASAKRGARTGSSARDPLTCHRDFAATYDTVWPQSTATLHLQRQTGGIE
ncbi:MAG: hypothetical protein ACRD4Y_04740, partial [Candidatus Acidiferrales bacterium]